MKFWGCVVTCFGSFRKNGNRRRSRVTIIRLRTINCTGSVFVNYADRRKRTRALDASDTHAGQFGN